ANLIRSCLRHTNTAAVAESSMAARLGGDEFAILLNGLRFPDDAAGVAERILKQLSSPFHLFGRQMFASLSIGIAMDYHGSTPEDLLRNADTAMYHAKTKGKGRFEIFDEKMHQGALARLEMETDIRTAINRQQLVLYYQPRVCLRSLQITGYEALVR